MDDTWVIQQQASKQEFLENINKVDPAIKFTLEGTQGNGAIPFLDTLVTLQADGSLSITLNEEWQKIKALSSNIQKDNNYKLGICEVKIE